MPAVASTERDNAIVFRGQVQTNVVYGWVHPTHSPNSEADGRPYAALNRREIVNYVIPIDNSNTSMRQLYEQVYIRQ
jgi:hypothetical protein